jgi:hypothetical protein
LSWLRHVALVVAACLLLTGCVLKSPSAIFGDGQGVLALEALGKTFTMESFSNGQWKVEEEAIFTPEGQHYVMSSPEGGKTPVEVLFVALEGNRFVVQAREAKDKPFTYLLAEMGKGEVLVTLISCDELKKIGTFAQEISFEAGDCTFSKTPDLALFQKIAGAAAPAISRLRPVH